MVDNQTTGVFGIDGWELLNSRLGAEGYEVKAALLTSPAGCPRCGGPVKRNGTKPQRIQDAPAHGRPVTLCFARQRYVCLRPDCRGTCLQPLAGVDERHRVTARLMGYIKGEAFRLGRSFSGVAAEAGISEKTLRAMFREYAAEVGRSSRAREASLCIGIDEVRLGVRTPCVIVDNINRRVIAILDRRNKTIVRRFLLQLPGWQNIKIVTIDMCKPYRDAVRDALPGAMIIIDKFHVIDMVNKAVNKVRVERRNLMTRKERKVVLRDRTLLWKRPGKLTPAESANLETWLQAMPDLRLAYDLKEAFLCLYRSRDAAAAVRDYGVWAARVPDDLRYAFRELLTAMKTWTQEVFNVVDHRFTNAFAERVNKDIRKIYDDGSGCSLEVVRAKMLNKVYNRGRGRATRKRGGAHGVRRIYTQPTNNTARGTSGVAARRPHQPLLPLFQSEPPEA